MSVERRIGKEVVPAFGERPPRLDLDTALAQQRLIVGALEERMALDLIDHRRDFVVFDQITNQSG